MLRIDERELKAKLNEHKSLIGRGSVGDGIGNLVAGVFYIHLPSGRLLDCGSRHNGLFMA